MMSFTRQRERARTEKEREDAHCWAGTVQTLLGSQFTAFYYAFIELGKEGDGNS